MGSEALLFPWYFVRIAFASVVRLRLISQRGDLESLEWGVSQMNVIGSLWENKCTDQLHD